jgi:hypothetical protein
VDGERLIDKRQTLLGACGLELDILDSREIASAVSAVLRCENVSRVEAADAEQCGYGDLR